MTNFLKLLDFLKNRNNYKFKTQVFVISQVYILGLAILTLLGYLFISGSALQLPFWIAISIISFCSIEVVLRMKKLITINRFINYYLAFYSVFVVPIGIIVSGSITSPSSIYIIIVIAIIAALTTKWVKHVLITIIIIYCILFIHIEAIKPELLRAFFPVGINELAAWTIIYLIVILFVFSLVSTTRKLIDENSNTINKQKDKLYHLSITDYLTGTYNKKHLNHKLEEIPSNIKDYDESYIFISIDIDHFKVYNDTYGHIEGDVCLKRISKIFIDSVEEFDGSVYRFGGEEFIIIIKTKDFNIGKKAIENINNEMKNNPIENINSKTEPFLTISIGVIQYDKSNINYSVNDILHQLDFALYKAKEKGRNQSWSYNGKDFWRVC